MKSNITASFWSWFGKVFAEGPEEILSSLRTQDFSPRTMGNKCQFTHVLDR
jgi:hypothetical protein